MVERLERVTIFCDFLRGQVEPFFDGPERFIGIAISAAGQDARQVIGIGIQAEHGLSQVGRFQTGVVSQRSQDD